MTEYEKNKFLNSLEKNGIDKVKNNLLIGVYDGEYLELAERWLKTRESQQKTMFSKNNIIIALVGLLIAILAFILKS